jgi:kelch-like protein 20
VGVAVLDGFLYAVGGQDGVQCLNHVERYDPKGKHQCKSPLFESFMKLLILLENKWSKVAPMTTRRLGVAVAVLGGFLYAIGGSDGQTPLNTVERFDPRSNKWTVVAPMSTRRKHLGCAGKSNSLSSFGYRNLNRILSF